MTTTPQTPWTFLDAYRGIGFKGTWPTLPEVFAITLDRHPDRPFLTIYEPDRISLTYRESDALISTVARHLRSLSIGKDSMVAVTGKNSPEWAVAYLATLRAGAVVVPIDYQLGSQEIKRLIEASGSTVLFVDEEKEADLKAALPGLKTFIGLASTQENYLYKLRAPAESELAPVQATAETDLAAILYTSGTTGNPKGVMLTHRNFVSDCFLAQAHMQLYPEDVFYALLPIHHSYTMLAVFLEAMSVGAEIVFGKRMIIKQVLADLRQARVTMFLGVPLLFNKVLAGIQKGIKDKGPLVSGILGILMGLSGFMKKAFGINPGKKLFHTVLDKASLATNRICISGGGPLAPSVFATYNQLGIDFVQGYGLTETSPILTLNPVDHYKETSVGKFLPQVEAKLIDIDADGRGEIVVKGPMVMQGYYRMPEETAEAFTPDGWFRTGDVGWIDSENYLYLTGRAKNMIVTEGGKNVYPEEIENAFQLYPEVEQVMVCGYLENKDTRSEGIEARIFGNPDWTAGQADPAARLRAIVAEVNHGLLPYQKITRVTILDEAMQMTTKKTIKRNLA